MVTTKKYRLGKYKVFINTEVSPIKSILYENRKNIINFEKYFAFKHYTKIRLVTKNVELNMIVLNYLNSYIYGSITSK